MIKPIQFITSLKWIRFYLMARPQYSRDFP